jgi:tetratricopeptide (TPR) repeat protein
VTSPGAASLWAVTFIAASAISVANVQQLLDSGIEQFKVGYGAWDRAQFVQAADTFQQACTEQPDSYEAHYWLGAARFHIVLHRLGDKENPANPAENRRLISEAAAPLRRAVRLRDRDSESHALLSTLIGIQIAGNPKSALWLGPKTIRHRRHALRNDPENPRVYYLIGTSYFNAPGILGGRQKGLKFFLKAERLFVEESKKPPQPMQPRWGYSSCLTFIGRTYQDIGRAKQAEIYFRKALSVNPQDKMAQKGLKALGKEESVENG